MYRMIISTIEFLMLLCNQEILLIHTLNAQQIHKFNKKQPKWLILLHSTSFPNGLIHHRSNLNYFRNQQIVLKSREFKIIRILIQMINITKEETRVTKRIINLHSAKKTKMKMEALRAKKKLGLLKGMHFKTTKMDNQTRGKPVTCF